MDLKELSSPGLILLDQHYPDRDAAIAALVEKLDAAGKLLSKRQFLEAVREREAQGPTALGEELAIPHGKSSGVKEPCFAVARLNEPLEWEGLDGPEPVRLIVMLGIPTANQGDTHIHILTEISSQLVDDDIREALMQASTPEQFLEILSPVQEAPEAPKEAVVPPPSETSLPKRQRVVCITSCPTGIAHTYRAADYLQKAGNALNVDVFVEKQGSKGIEDPLTAEQLANADAAIIASEIAIQGGERFAHLPTLYTTVAEPIRRGKEVIERALALPPVEHTTASSTQKPTSSSNNPQSTAPVATKQSVLALIKQALLTGVSHAIPFIAAGGIMIALAIAFVPITSTGPDFSNAPNLKTILTIGEAAFGVLLPLLAGYISFGLAGRSGLVAGFVGGALAGTTGAGFLGALVAGLLAGFVVKGIQKIPVPRSVDTLMPILIIPIISGLIVGVVMLRVIGAPIADIMENLGLWLREMGTTNSILLGLILGSMIAFDMGGPVNKAAFFFGAAMIQEGNTAIMGAVAAAICIPPISMGVATKLAKNLWSEQEQEAGTAAILMGTIGITEGAIPFAVADPLRVIPSIVTGSAISATIAMMMGVGDHAPHGGLIVLPVIDGRISYVLAIALGVVISAFMVNMLKRIGRSSTEMPSSAEGQKAS